jgi:ABC-type nitrate/sulfonate/bicarbonate transport system substrate-binding protein
MRNNGGREWSSKGCHVEKLAVILLLTAAIFPYRADAQDKLTKFRFVHLEANGSQAVPFIAKEARLFEKNGLDVEIIRIGGGSRVIQAMLAGEIRVSHGSSPAVVEANLAGADLVIIASTVNVATFRMMVAPTIKSPSDLKGKRIGISRFGGQTDTLTRYLLERWRVDGKDVALIQTGGGAETAAAMVSRAIDGALVNPPLHLNLADAGFRTMANLGEMGVPYTSGSVVTTRSFVKNNPDLLRRVMRSMLEGIKIYKTDREFSLKALEKYTRNHDKKVLSALWEEFGNGVIQRVPYADTAGFKFVLDEVAVRRPEAKKMNVEELIDNRFVQELEHSGFVKSLYGGK